jgi:hypothetical protein
MTEKQILRNWALRPAASNDALLRNAFLNVLEESRDLPPEEKLIMYDACDAKEVRAPLAEVFRKRLDARRNTKPKKSDDQRFVCTPFNPNGFHFGKIRNDKERLVKLALRSGRYDVLTNKFPLFPKHMLLVADALVPQQMTAAHLSAVTELIGTTSGFCAYFNSWCASASVNHFHCHVIDEHPPVAKLPLVSGPVVAGTRCLQPQGFLGFCFVFPFAALAEASLAIEAMQLANQPHNLLVTPHHVYIFPKPLNRPERSFELYPETVGGPELLGSFTVYTPELYQSLDAPSCDELMRLNTAPLPTRFLQTLDDDAVPGANASARSAAHAGPFDVSDGAGAAHAAPLPPSAPGARQQIRESKSLDLHALLPRHVVGAASAAGWRGRRRDAGGGA